MINFWGSKCLLRLYLICIFFFWQSQHLLRGYLEHKGIIKIWHPHWHSHFQAGKSDPPRLVLLFFRHRPFPQGCADCRERGANRGDGTRFLIYKGRFGPKWKKLKSEIVVISQKPPSFSIYHRHNLHERGCLMTTAELYDCGWCCMTVGRWILPPIISVYFSDTHILKPCCISEYFERPDVPIAVSI